MLWEPPVLHCIYVAKFSHLIVCGCLLCEPNKSPLKQACMHTATIMLQKGRGKKHKGMCRDETLHRYLHFVKTHISLHQQWKG